jgi:DMSO/TMAO reductase YedYZ heme-binding membrane subunit
MKYLLILVFALTVLLLVKQLVLNRKSPDGLGSLVAKIKDLGTRFHLAIGIMAVLIIVYFLVTSLFRVKEFP